MDPVRVEKALTYALGCSLGKKLKPLSHRGKENPGDVEAIGVLMDLRRELGIRIEPSPVIEAPTITLEDWSDSKKAPQY